MLSELRDIAVEYLQSLPPIVGFGARSCGRCCFPHKMNQIFLIILVTFPDYPEMLPRKISGEVSGEAFL